MRYVFVYNCCLPNLNMQVIKFSSNKKKQKSTNFLLVCWGQYNPCIVAVVVVVVVEAEAVTCFELD